MTLYLLIIAMTVAACAAVLLPLLGKRGQQAPGLAYDLEVYSSQMRELEADKARGALSDADFEEARAEVGRKLLATGKRLEQSGVDGTSTAPMARIVSTVAILSVPVLAVGLYAALGNPGLPAQPLQARLTAPPQDNSIEELVVRAERHLADNPADARGWEVLAPIYLRLGRLDDSVSAHERAIALQGSNAPLNLRIGLGEALTMQSGGIVTEKAEGVFREILAASPGEPVARFYLAMAKAQHGDKAGAIADWNALLSENDDAGAWRDLVRQAIADAGGEPVAPTGQPRGPSAADVAAAQEMTADERATMIEGMVSQLAERLKDEPEDAEGWLRLVRAYGVLGREDDARQALADGLQALRDKPDDKSRLVALAREMQIEIPGADQ